MDAALDLFHRQGRIMVKPEDAIRALGEFDLFRVHVPGETAALRQALRLRQKLFLAEQLSFSPFSVFNLDVGAIPLDDVAPLIAQRAGAKEKPSIDTIKTPDASLYVDLRARAQGSLP